MSPEPADCDATMRLNLLTYNIHKGIGGVDRRYRLDRIAEVIDHYDPHVLLLQEVDDGARRSRGDCQASLLAEQLQYPYVLFQPNVRLRRGVYGNALLSRLPIRDSEDVDLTVGPKKRRRAQVARLEVHHQGHQRTLVVANVHLGLSGFERRIQLRRLLNDSPIARLHRDTPCVIAGDFNDVWGAIGKRIMAPAGFRAATKNERTFPARAPLRSLDGVYYRGDCQLHQAYAGRLDLARQASDHLPLYAELIARMAH